MNALGKTALFIDGANLHFTTRSLGFEVDFKRLVEEFEKHGSILRCYFYTTISEAAEFTTIRPLIDWLDYNGFTVRARPEKVFDDGNGRRKVKRNIGVELAVDALEIAKHVDHVVLFSGDGDFRSLVEAVQGRGPRVTVVSSVRTKPAIIADELRRQADTFLELEDLRAYIGRTPPTVAAHRLPDQT
jgi:uncharacterized LabA/DUF88 family protein